MSNQFNYPPKPSPFRAHKPEVHREYLEEVETIDKLRSDYTDLYEQIMADLEKVAKDCDLTVKQFANVVTCVAQGCELYQPTKADLKVKRAGIPWTDPEFF